MKKLHLLSSHVAAPASLCREDWKMGPCPDHAVPRPDSAPPLTLLLPQLLAAAPTPPCYLINVKPPGVHSEGCT